MTSGYELLDYAFVGDIHQVSMKYIFKTWRFSISSTKLLPLEGEIDMETNPYITVTGTSTLMITCSPWHQINTSFSPTHLYLSLSMPISPNGNPKKGGVPRDLKWPLMSFVCSKRKQTNNTKCSTTMKGFTSGQDRDHKENQHSC